MNPKSLIWIGMAVGSTIGGLIPFLWGASITSMWGIFLSAIGALLGIYFGYKIGRYQ